MKKEDLKQSATAAGENARDAVTDSVATARGVVGRITSFLSPRVADARERVEPLVADAVDRVAPHVAEAAEKVAPYYEKTRDAVTEGYDKNVKPRVREFVDRASENEHVAKAARKGSDVVENLKSRADASVVQVAPKKKHHRVLKGLGIAALLGGAVVAVRQLLLPKDDGWTPQEPSTAYTDNDASYDYAGEARRDRPKEDSADTEPGGAVKFTEPDTATEHLEPADVTVSTEASDLPQGAAGARKAAPAQPDVAKQETGDAEPTELDEANDSHETGDAAKGGAGYRGANPPEGYTIKGNERSMKFHVPGGAGYSRTNADVWFKTIEEAEAAGFTKASR